MNSKKLTGKGIQSRPIVSYFVNNHRRNMRMFVNRITSAVFINLMNGRRNRKVSIIHLLIWAIFVCFMIRTWKMLGCFGVPDCYLCRTFTPDMIINSSATSSPADDFARLINLNNFTFLMNNYPCNNADLLLLVLVHSDPENFEKRSTIRTTWGNFTDNKFKLLFLLGIPNSSTVQKRLQEENDANGDLVQGNFADSYRNLTYKHVMALKWTKYFCPKARFLLKTDDDIFVNLPNFLTYLTCGLPKRGLMRCLPVYDGLAKRTTRSKWRVTMTEYQFRKYPPFCQGFAVLYSPDVVEKLYAKAQTASYFWIDDVFVTGFLAMSSNYTPSAFGEHLLEPQEFRKLINRGRDLEDFCYVLGPWDMKVLDIRKLWEITVKAKQKIGGIRSSVKCSCHTDNS